MSNIVFYRNKCIGCGICHEMQPDTWRMSKKDGKATLVHAQLKKLSYILEIPVKAVTQAKETASACPVRAIKTS